MTVIWRKDRLGFRVYVTNPSRWIATVLLGQGSVHYLFYPNTPTHQPMVCTSEAEAMKYATGEEDFPAWRQRIDDQVEE